MALAEQLDITVDDYLQGELQSEIKHNYINGAVFAMAGAKRTHDTIATNLIAFLHAHLRGTPCRVHSSDMKVRIQTANAICFFYPDLQVTCSAADVEPLFNCEPKLIIEILSDSTERYDRADKFHYYRKLDSLQEYVLVAQDTQRIECYRRAGEWDFELFKAGERFCFQSVDLTLPVANVYEGIVF